MTQICLENLSTDTKPMIEVKKSLPRYKKGELFLKGPLRWDWLLKAGNCPGKALQTAIVLCLIAGIDKKQTVTLSGKRLRKMGVKRNSGYRGLSALEKAGLVTVKRHPGRNSIVTLINFV